MLAGLMVLVTATMVETAPTQGIDQTLIRRAPTMGTCVCSCTRDACRKCKTVTHHRVLCRLAMLGIGRSSMDILQSASYLNGDDYS